VSTLSHVYSGKVRELYADADGRLLLVATDRMSAYDHILQPPIPDKGRILTAMSLWWFDQLAGLVPHHVLSTDVPAEFRGRAIWCRRLDMVPIECVARGYLTGSGLTDYRATGALGGVELPPGLDDGAHLPEAVFTPATKAPQGEHDENIGFAQVVDLLGPATAERLRELTLAVYSFGAEVARDRGILIADTKVEFGRDSTGDLVLADEVLTPDSSRFWPADRWQPGQAQPSFDKQYVRDWLTSPESGWDRASSAPPPPLPAPVVAATRARYIEAYERLTGEAWS
jgi:phosphoribosylaminoimidazole-succinocarboxamide synthase